MLLFAQLSALSAQDRASRGRPQRPGARVIGCVDRRRGRGLPGVDGRAAAAARARSRARVTSGDGVFRILDVAPGDYSIRITARGLRAADAGRTARVGARSWSRSS